jgi:hypothetical protein
MIADCEEMDFAPQQSETDAHQNPLDQDPGHRHSISVDHQPHRNPWHTIRPQKSDALVTLL